MPIYEYECPKCGRIEVVQKASDAPLKKCPQCKDQKHACTVERVISASSFHLKGSGWYKTDYSSSSSSNGGGKIKRHGESKTSETKESASDSSSATKDSGTTKDSGGGKCGSGCGCH